MRCDRVTLLHPKKKRVELQMTFKGAIEAKMANKSAQNLI